MNHALPIPAGHLSPQNDGVKVGANYKAGAEKIDVVDKFVSQGGESADVRKATYEESEGWYTGITSDMFS